MNKERKRETINRNENKEQDKDTGQEEDTGRGSCAEEVFLVRGEQLHRLGVALPHGVLGQPLGRDVFQHLQQSRALERNE